MQEPVETGPVAVRLTPSRTRVEEWALVLASAGIAHRVLERDDAFALEVAAADARAARDALAAFDAESAPVVVPPAPDLGPSALGVAVAVLLLAFYVVTGSGEASTPSDWFRAGSASADLILRGQWWRAVTALTLHGDAMHIGGNVVASLLFVSAVGRWLGPGLGAVLILASAAAANLLVAVAHRTRHDSIGASTATFAALGILAGLQIVHRLQHGELPRRAWLIPLGAGLGLFAMTGVSEHADILAHLFGLGAGVLAGAGAAISGLRAPGRLAQAGLALLALGTLVGCWLLALR
jgi:membrane associated rhomboid family serine protease